MATEEPIPVKLFVDFRDYFEPIFNSFLGGHIDKSILPPKNELKIGSKACV